MSDPTPPSRRLPIAPVILGLIMALIGVVLSIGGVWLAALGGSAYYIIAGIGLIASGVLLARRRLAGAWLYCAVFVGTLIWAFAEVGTDNWALVPRVIAPLVLLIATFLVVPALTDARHRWRYALAGTAGVLALTVVLAVTFARMNDAVPRSSLPPLAAAMGEPALMAAGNDWPAYGGSYSARRFSPLGQITPANVTSLKRAWLFHTGDLPSSAKVRGTYGGENTPLKVGDMLYVCTPKNIVIALDPASGKQRWRFNPGVSDEAIPYTAACRGVSYFAVPGATPAQTCGSRILFGTLDARLFAIDARTGARCRDFGRNGEVDTKIGMGATRPGYVSINSPPTIVRGVAVTGHQVLDGQDRWAPSGVIRGFDAVTGRLRWAWDMMHPDWTGYPPKGQTWARGTPNMWTIASGRAIGAGLPAHGQFGGGLSFRPASIAGKCLRHVSGRFGRDNGQAALAFPSGAQGCVGLRLRCAGDAGRLSRYASAGSAIQAGRHLCARPAHGKAADADRRAARACGRGGAAAAFPDAAGFAVAYIAQARSGRTGHVGHVADRSDDLPHPAPPGELQRLLHAT